MYIQEKKTAIAQLVRFARSHIKRYLESARVAPLTLVGALMGLGIATNRLLQMV